jgi:hypothetical protein
LGSLDGWYLFPWQEREQRPIERQWKYLWLDIKGPGDSVEEALRLRLQDLLRSPQRRSDEPSIILTGDQAIKERLTMESRNWGFGDALVGRDSHVISLQDPVRIGLADGWTWYSLSWADEFSWDGQGRMSEGEWNQLCAQVKLAHSKSRKIRYYHVPSTPEWIATAGAAGVDLLDVDDLSLLPGSPESAFGLEIPSAHGD